MALEPESEPLARALEIARRPDPAWPEIREAALRRIRSLVPPGEPVTVVTAAGSPDRDVAGSRTAVSTRVLAAALRRVLTVSPTHAPRAVDLVVEAGRLERVDLELVVAYGVAVEDLAPRVHVDVRAELVRLLGAGAVAPGAVTLTVVDVVPGDPTVT
ncbi:hypothetical protein [Nocardioides lianchengensis]|uniref:Asp23 family, cell envelope-related function n=1 Tax=Nocardioides lianchengensis TaxID=1045774 RepID=A0A1G6S8R1_9ACTN|nr:hypothetical protein [Nocardioides lianchengensis]NYG09749.1 putative alkaline shock family protein YloU [Nocardioides lianchengensis]SDD13113.1 hypothetical protein SAMN05421872_10658 [Nocardioides lianchengensis]